MQPEDKISRRDIVRDLTTGIAAGIAAPAALAQSAQSEGQGTAAQTHSTTPFMPNPLTEYPRPPFPSQEQPWPGLVSKMTPRPDHGETSYRGSGRLAGRKALITGGDSGMGRAAAIAFAREGADVVINYLPQEQSDADEVLGLIRAAGRKAVGLPGDIREEAFCVSLVSQAIAHLGGLNILVSNAARQVAQPSILDISSEQFDTTLKTNVYAMFWLTKAAVPHMPPGSAIINTSSINAFNPEPYILDYDTTKAAIAIWTKGLAKQLISKGIRVNAVAPGPIWTPLQVTGGQFPENIPSFGSTAPIGRAGEPAELAPLYVLLADNKASYSTGQIFGATGGESGP
jgi:NAD(P)-dependent dehydrogenase (short-subunit alcohol dehydrogenase family)